MQINYLSAPAGAGKTHALVTEINRLIQDGERVILCQPTIRLIDQTKISLRERFPTIDPMVIHGYGAVGQIMTYLKSPFPEPHVLFITWEAFQRLEFIQNRSTWHLIVDEIPQAFDCFDEVLPEGHGLITSYLKTEPSETTSYSYLLPFDRKSIRQIAENKEQDKVWELFKPLAARLESKDWQKYVQTEPYQKLCEDRSDGKRLTVFSFLNPSIFDGFGSVMIAGACFEDSILYKSFSKRGVTFKEAEHLKSEFRYQTHNGDGVTICYAIDQNWSKRLRDKDNKAVWSRMVDGVKGHFAIGLFVWSANKDIKDDYLFGAKAASMRLPQSPHGLNTFSEVDNVVFLSAYNLIPAHAKFIESHLKMNREEIQTAVHRQQVYQGVMRSSMRNPSNRRRKFVLVPDLQTAQWLHQMLQGSTLQFLDFNLGLKPSIRGRKRLHQNDNERKQASRERLKKERAEHVHQITLKFSNTLDPSCEKTCDEITILNSNNVAQIRASLFENKESAIPCVILVDSLEAFEDAMKEHYQVSYANKEQNRLISPSIFDPEKSQKTSRGNDNFITANSIWLDFDGGDLTQEAFANLFPELRMTIYSTYSSTKKDQRFRVFIPASSEIPLTVYKAITGQILQRMKEAGYALDKKTAGNHQKAHGLDRGKMGPSSLFYLPCQPQDPKGKYFRIFRNGDRKPLDVEDWIEHLDAMAPDYQWETYELASVDQPSDGWMEERIASARQFWRDQCHISGVGNNEFFRLAAKLQATGCSDDEARQILLEEASYARSPTERRAEIDRLIQRLWYMHQFTPTNAGHVEHLYK